MKILVFGANGMLGHKLVQRLSSQFEVFGTIRGAFESVEQFGIFKREFIIEHVSAQDVASIEAAIQTAQPDVVINAIGIVKQLPTAKEVIATLEVNSIFPHRLAEFSQKYGFRLITVSTDCVFDGEKGNYVETDTTNATDLYGRSKALGEVTFENCLTLRTSIIGRELGEPHSLIDWFLSNRGGVVKGFTKAIYSGFPTVVFADMIVSLIIDQPQLSGLYQVASEPINKFELLTLVNSAFDANITIEPSDEVAIDRSLNGSKFTDATGFKPIPWPEMVELMANDAVDSNETK